ASINLCAIGWPIFPRPKYPIIELMKKSSFFNSRATVWRYEYIRNSKKQTYQENIRIKGRYPLKSCKYNLNGFLIFLVMNFQFEQSF
ncbi:MAG: hypothetical protein CMM43_07155, partial [Rhodospirillaceae bacterium]|nr:hypothetical protein [Rhodospirillaceae bacterium]